MDFYFIVLYGGYTGDDKDHDDNDDDDILVAHGQLQKLILLFVCM